MRRILDFGFWILDYTYNPKSKIQNPKFVLVAAGLFCVMLIAPAAAIACPGCKEALIDPSTLSQRLGAARGYALSIGILLSVPVALIGGVTALIVRSARRHRHPGSAHGS